MEPAAMDAEDEAALVEQHADVLFAMDASGRLTPLNEPEVEQAPRLFLARGRTPMRIWFRADVPGAVSDACRVLAAPSNRPGAVAETRVRGPISARAIARSRPSAASRSLWRPSPDAPRHRAVVGRAV